MKKLKLISFVAIILAIIGLALLKVTGMTGHIVISVIALLIMVVCAVLEKKNWKKPALEIIYRLAYLIALITGIVMVASELSGAVSIVHKVAAGAFAALYIVSIVDYFLSKKKS